MNVYVCRGGVGGGDTSLNPLLFLFRLEMDLEDKYTHTPDYSNLIEKKGCSL